MGLEHAELAMALEEEFGLSLPPKSISGVRTVGDVQALVVASLRQRSAMFDDNQVNSRVREIITRVGRFKEKLDPTMLTSEMRLIEDLGWG